MKRDSLCIMTRGWGVSGMLTSEDNYSTYTLSIYDHWYLYHPREWAGSMAALGLPAVVRKQKRPRVLQRDKDGYLVAMLCRSGYVLARDATGKQVRNVWRHAYGNGMVFPAEKYGESPQERKWAADHGYLSPYRARTWCPVHRCLHGHVNYASPTFGMDCMYERHPEWTYNTLFRSIPQHTFVCAVCGKHVATVRKERAGVWKTVHDEMMGRRDGWHSAWDVAKLAERAHVCCGGPMPEAREEEANAAA